MVCIKPYVNICYSFNKLQIAICLIFALVYLLNLRWCLSKEKFQFSISICSGDKVSNNKRLANEQTEKGYIDFKYNFCMLWTCIPEASAGRHLDNVCHCLGFFFSYALQTSIFAELQLYERYFFRKRESYYVRKGERSQWRKAGVK